MKKRYIVGSILAAPFVGILTIAAIVGSQSRADDIAACNNHDQVACDKVFKTWTASWDKVTNPAFQARVAEHNAAEEAAQAAKEAKAQQKENRDHANRRLSSKA